MKYNSGGQVCENVYHVLGASEWTTTTLGALGVYFENWENTLGKTRRGTSTQLQAVICVALVTEDGPAVFSAVAIDGTEPYELLPNNVTLAIKWTTNKRGRSYRGRTYWIGLSLGDQSSVNSNQIDSGRATDILNDMTTLMTGTKPNGGQLVVLSYANDCTWRTTAEPTVIVAATLTDPVFDSQRRRLPAHNIHH